MFSPSRFLLLAVAVLAVSSLGCNNRSRGGGLPSDAGMMTLDSGMAGDADLPDTTRPVDSSVRVDSSRPDSSFPMDSGTRDTSTPPRDSGTTADTSLPPLDSSLPLGDGGFCIPGMVECAPPLVCCELLPGTGLGSCAPSC